MTGTTAGIVHMWRRPQHTMPSYGIVFLALVACLLVVLEPAVTQRLLLDGAPDVEDSVMSAAPPAVRPAGPDPESVIDRINHRFERSPTAPHRLTSSDDDYRVVVDGKGIGLLPLTSSGSALVLATTSVERGDASIPLSPGDWAPTGNTAERPLAPGIQERVTTRAGEAEWDVVLGRDPSGQGDLRIRTRLSGAADAPVRSDDGKNWRWPLRGGGVVRTGEVVVRDAAGRTWLRTLPHASRTGMSVVVPNSVLERATYPLTIDPVISPEHPVADRTLGRAPGHQSKPAVAFDGTNFLVVWSDGRDGGSRLWGARVDPGGQLLDSTGILIAAPDQGVDHPAISFDGTNFLVVWEDEAGFPTEEAINISSIRVTPAGAVLGTAQRVAEDDMHDQGDTTVTFDGTNWLVVWVNAAGYPDLDIYARRVSSGGNPVGSAFAISTAADVQLGPAISSNGAGSLVVWEDYRNGSGDIYGARVDNLGVVLDPAGIAVSSGAASQTSPAVAFGSTSYLVTWGQVPSGLLLKIYGARVSSSGAVLDPGTAPFVPGSGNQSAPALAFDGSRWLVTFQRGLEGARDIAGFRVRQSGQLLGSVITITDAAGDQRQQAIAFGGGHHLVPWADPGNVLDIVAKRVTPLGTVLDGTGLVVSVGYNDQTAPAVAFDGTNFLVVWSDDRSSSGEIYGARVRPDGIILDANGFRIGSGEGLAEPAVQFDGTNFFVVWRRYDAFSSDAYDVLGARVSPNTTVLDPTPIPVSTGSNDQFNPALSFDTVTDSYLVVYHEADPSHQSLGIRGIRVSDDGTILDTSGIAIAATTGFAQSDPDVAFNGTDHLVVWSVFGFDGSPVLGARVAADGTVRDPGGITIADAPGYQYGARVASNGSNSLVVWQKPSDGILAARVAADGTVLDSPALPVGDSPQDGEATVAANGGYLVVWVRRHDNENSTLMAGRVSSGGAVQDPSGFAIATATTPTRWSHDTAAAGGDDWAVVYQLQAGSAGVEARSFLRTVSPK